MWRYQYSHGEGMGIREGIGSLKERASAPRTSPIPGLTDGICIIEDTSFRLYRESNPALKNTTWISVAGTIDELKAVALDLDEHGNKHSGELARKIYAAVPRFEEGENVRNTNLRFNPATYMCRNGNAASTASNAGTTSVIKQLHTPTKAAHEESE